VEAERPCSIDHEVVPLAAGRSIAAEVLRLARLDIQLHMIFSAADGLAWRRG
jgi:hypothetical protein